MMLKNIQTLSQLNGISGDESQVREYIISGKKSTQTYSTSHNNFMIVNEFQAPNREHPPLFLPHPPVVVDSVFFQV